MVKSYGRIGNQELTFLEDVIAYALDLQHLAQACARLSDDPVALRFAQRSHDQAKALQQEALQYQAQRRKEARG